MRHHLAVIEGLIKQNENENALEYISRLNGSIGETDGMRYCGNPEINAVLSEYIARAESAGCRITRNLFMPHRAYIANLDNSVGIVRYDLLMLGNRRIPIPKNRFADVQEVVRNHFFKMK